MRPMNVRFGPIADIMASAEASLAARWQLRLCYSALHGSEHAKVAIHRPAWRRSHVAGAGTSTAADGPHNWLYEREIS